MAIVAVGADNLRADAMDTTANIGGIGGGAGAGVEDEAYYQNGLAISRKVTAAGFFTDTGAQRDMSVSGRSTVLYKVLVSNFAGITNLEARIGSAATAYSQYIFADNSTLFYKPVGGFLIFAIDPNETGYRDGVTGSPAFTAADYFGIYAAGPTSKAENLVLDAIDIGYGLYLTGGTSTDTDGEFADYVADDEGDATNGRYGYVVSVGGIPFVVGMLVKGATTASGARTAAATEFTDLSGTVVFFDTLAAAGFSGIIDDLGNAGTTITVKKNFVSRGNTTTTDTRAVFEGYGTAGSADYTGSSFANFASFLLTTAFDFSGVSFSDCGLVTVAGATLAKASFVGGTAAADLLWNTATDPNGELDGCTFICNANHAVELGANTPTTIALNGHSYSGYDTGVGSNAVASTGPTDAAIYNNSGKTITINVLGGGDSPSVRNGAGATTVVVTGLSELAFTVSPSITGYEWRIYTVTALGSLAGQSEVDGEESAVADNQAYSYTYSEGAKYAIQILPGANDYEESITYYSASSTDQDVIINLTPDINN